MWNVFKLAVSGLPAAGRMATLTITIALVGVVGTVLFPSQITSRTGWADEPRAAATASQKPKELTDDEKTALAEYHKLYHLDEDQVVKYIKPPFVAGRLIDRNQRWKDRFGNADHGKDGMYVYCYVFMERDGKLEPPHHFAAGSRHPDLASNGVELTTLMGMITKVSGREIVGPGNLLNRRVVGDWIIRADAPMDEIIAGVGTALNRECGVPIKLETQETDEDIVVVRGGGKPQFVPKLDSPVKLYVKNFQTGLGDEGQGTYREFLDAVGEFIEPNRRVVSEVRNLPQAMISWHRNVPDRFDDGDVGLALEHLEDQTGLKFAMEPRKIRKIIVTRSE